MGRLTTSELRSFHDGDEALFRRLVEENSPRLLAIARRFTGDMDEAHDTVQEVWRRAYEKRRTYSGAGTILGWLYAVCRSVCLADAKKKAWRSGAEVTAEMLSGSGAPESVYLALAELPARERDVVILRMLEGHSTREAAAAMDCAEGTVKAALPPGCTRRGR